MMMMFRRVWVLQLLLLCSTKCVSAFQPHPALLARVATTTTTPTPTTKTTTRTFRSTTAVFMSSSKSNGGIKAGVIKGIREDAAPVDFGRCGVKLAEDSIVKMSGTCKTTSTAGGGGAQWNLLDNFMSYTDLGDTLPSLGDDITLIGKGVGTENFQDVGTGTTKVVEYGPDEAAKVVLATATNIPKGTTSIVINIAGGNDLQVTQVLEAVEKVADGLVLASSSNAISVVWNSLSYTEFPEGQASMVVMAVQNKKSMLDRTKDDEVVTEDEDSGEGLTGKARSLAMGEMYMVNGKYLTVLDEEAIVDFTQDWMV